MAIYKNKASQKLAVFAVDSTGAAKTGDAANITAQISLNGGACAATNDTNPTELDAADAKGIYLFDLTQAETNADLVIVSAVSVTSGVTLRPAIIYTEPENRTVGDYASGKDPTAMVLTLANGVESGYSLQQALKLVLSALAGKVSGAGTTTVTIRDVGDAKNRIIATVDADGNRSAFTYDLT